MTLPVFVDVGPLSLSTYTLFHVGGILAGLALGFRALKRLPLSGVSSAGILLMLLIAAHLGAHLYHVAFNLAWYLTNPRNLFRHWDQGLSIHGGLIGAGLGILAASRLSRQSLWKMADALAPAAALALVFFRLGCHARGCCYGLPCGEDFLFAGVTRKIIGNTETSVHPTQLYSAAGALGLFLVLLALGRRKLFDGALGIVFLLLLSSGRFLMEFLRASYLQGRTSITLFGTPLNLNQIIAVGFFGIGLLLLALRRRDLGQGIRKNRGATSPPVADS